MGEVADAMIERAMFAQPSDYIDHHAVQSQVMRRPPRDTTFGFARRPSGLLVPATAAAVGVPEVPDDHYDHVSASQLKTWFRCRRLWWFQKCAMVKEPQRAHFGIGHALHHVSERYQLRLAKTWAEVFDPGWDKAITPQMAEWIRIMAAAAVEKGMWQATPDVQVEYPMAMLVGKEWTDDRGMPWLAHVETYTNKHGVRSIRQPTKLIDGSPLPEGWNRLPVMVGFADQLYLGWNPPEVGDHKSAKNRTYATTPKKLAEDVQVLNYSAAVFFARRDALKVALRHNVFLKNVNSADGAYIVRAEATLERVQQEWQRTIQAAEDMKLVRDLVSVHPSEYKSAKRADAWYQVKSAIEDGCAAESCNAYGGCPMRDVCNRRNTAEQVVRRLDGGFESTGPPATPTPPATFGLNVRPVGSPFPSRSIPPPSQFGLRRTHSQEPTMPFIKPLPAPVAPQANPNDRYLLDPENAQVQFRARLSPTEAPQEAGLVVLYLWPHLDVEPVWGRMSPIYRVELIPGQLSVAPYAHASLKGYHESLLQCGTPPNDCAWMDSAGVVHVQLLTLNSPVQPAATVPPPSAGTGLSPVTATPSKPAADGAFGLRPTTPAAQTPGVAQGVLQPGVGVALAQQMQRAMATPPMPPATFVPKVGQRVRVAAVEPSTEYFRGLFGKEGTVKDVVEGEGQPMVDVELDGGYLTQQVAVGRFTLVSEPPAAPSAEQAAANQLQQVKDTVKTYIGQVVEIRALGTAPVRAKLEAVDDAAGLTALSGALVVPWDKLEAVALVPEGAPAPGEVVKKPRQTKAQKEAAKAAEAAAGAAQGSVVATAAIGGTPPLFTPEDAMKKHQELMDHLAAANLCGAQLTEMLKHVVF